jgi:hypothetical protein
LVWFCLEFRLPPHRRRVLSSRFRLRRRRQASQSQISSNCESDQPADTGYVSGACVGYFSFHFSILFFFLFLEFYLPLSLVISVRCRVFVYFVLSRFLRSQTESISAGSCCDMGQNFPNLRSSSPKFTQFRIWGKYGDND